MTKEIELMKNLKVTGMNKMIFENVDINRHSNSASRQ